MAVSPETMAWLDWVSLTSVPLYRMDERDRPLGVASGCVVRIGERRLLLCVSHATRQGRWVAEARYDQTRGKTEVLDLGRQWTACCIDASRTMHEELDFSFVEVNTDFMPRMQERDEQGAITRERARHEFVIDLTEQPCVDETYAFSGRVHPARVGENTYWAEPTVYPGLTYQRTQGHYHVFALPVAHPGHDAFEGCSGAPIVDRQRRVVALVCKGDTDAHTVTGIGVHQLAAAIRQHPRTSGA